MKKYSPGILCAIVGVAVAGLPASAPAVDSGDCEYWQTNTVIWGINDDYAVQASEEFKMGRSGGNPFLHLIDLGLIYKGLADWLEISGNVKKDYARDSDGKFRQENRVHFNMTFKGHILDCAASNRSRIEYRDFQTQEDVYRFRNKTTVKFPWKLTAMQLQPYLADEIFVNLGDSDINKHRLAGGFSFKLCRNLNMGIYYLWQRAQITGGWRDTNVIGTEFKFAF